MQSTNTVSVVPASAPIPVTCLFVPIQTIFSVLRAYPAVSPARIIGFSAPSAVDNSNAGSKETSPFWTCSARSVRIFTSSL